MPNLAPIILFVYNRPLHTQKTIEALQKNSLAKDSELFIYSDGAKNLDSTESVNSVREYIKSINGFKKVTIIERQANFGLAESIIDGVTNIVNQFGKVIVLEDDLVTSPYFLQYMNDALTLYKDDESVASIHGYIYPIDNLPETFFIRGADCWGWAVWKIAWDLFEPDGELLLRELKSRKLEYEADFNGTYNYTRMLEEQILGTNNSWAVRWYMSCFLKSKLTLYPSKSYIKNIGLDGTGTHCDTDVDRFMSSEVSLVYKPLESIPLVEDLSSRKKMEYFFRSTKVNKFLSVINKLKSIVK